VLDRERPGSGMKLKQGQYGRMVSQQTDVEPIFPILAEKTN
jgi:hypothetical protein